MEVFYASLMLSSCNELGVCARYQVLCGRRETTISRER
jgi:hypothetical protein